MIRNTTFALIGAFMVSTAPTMVVAQTMPDITDASMCQAITEANREACCMAGNASTMLTTAAQAQCTTFSSPDGRTQNRDAAGATGATPGATTTTDKGGATGTDAGSGNTSGTGKGGSTGQGG